MQYDGTTYGIIPDTFSTILQNYLTALSTSFPNATSPDSPAYVLAYVSASMDQLLQSALTSLWNAYNANTAQGLGLDILANTVLNLERPGLVPSSCQLQVTIGPIYSTVQIAFTVSAGTFPQTIPMGTAMTPTTATVPYTTVAPLVIHAIGVFYVNATSTDTSTPIPANTFSGPTGIGSLTYTVTNPAPADLGSFTIPTTWAVTSPSVTLQYPYYPNAPQTYYTAGVYIFNVYSQDITTVVGPYQLTQADNFNMQITGINNAYQNIIGTAALNDAQFNELRRYYLNVEGQTYFGMEKAIIDLEIPGLIAVDIAETISEDTNYSILIVKVTIDVTMGGVTIPAGWTVTPSPGYMTLNSYTFPNGASPITAYIPTYSTDLATNVPIGTITGATPVIPQVTVDGNLDPAVLGSTLVPKGLGQRGYTIYLEYSTIPMNYVTLTLNVTAIGPNPPYVIPIGWQATGYSTINPYLTEQMYQIYTTGTVMVQCYSTDITTVVPVNGFTGGTAVPGLTFAFPATSTASAPVQNLDPNDPYLQMIAQTAFDYHPLGTQFYAAPVGYTNYVVTTPYSGYTSNVLLNPFQVIPVSCNLLLYYNTVPADAGFSNGIFDVSQLPTLQTQITTLINNYFLSKTLPTDTVYTINELSEIIQNQYTGIVALVGNPTVNSVCQIQLMVSGGTFPATLPIGWTATGGVITNAPYVTLETINIPGNGTYYFNVYSIDITTSVGASNFTNGTPTEGLTYTATNLAAATLETVTENARFSFGTITPLENDLLYLRRVIGSNFNLSTANFTFSALEKP